MGFHRNDNNLKRAKAPKHTVAERTACITQTILTAAVVLRSCVHILLTNLFQTNDLNFLRYYIIWAKHSGKKKIGNISNYWISLQNSAQISPHIILVCMYFLFVFADGRNVLSTKNVMLVIYTKQRRFYITLITKLNKQHIVI